MGATRIIIAPPGFDDGLGLASEAETGARSNTRLVGAR